MALPRDQMLREFAAGDPSHGGCTNPDKHALTAFEYRSASELDLMGQGETRLME
jgi:hypothetical protein